MKSINSPLIDGFGALRLATVSRKNSHQVSSPVTRHEGLTSMPGVMIIPSHFVRDTLSTVDRLQ